MRILRLLIVAAAAVCLAGSASAELIIYKGTLKQSASGLGVSKKLNSQIYLIVDHDTAAVAAIQFVTVNGSKTYGTMTETNFHFVQISAPKGKLIDAISEPASEIDVAQGNASDMVFVQGTESTLTVNTGSMVAFPKTLSGSDTEIDYSQGAPIIIQSTAVANFDGTQTPLSNGNGETFDAAVARISTMLEDQGYQKQSGETKRSRFPLRLVEN